MSQTQQAETNQKIGVDNIYGAFHPVVRAILKFWNRKISRISKDRETIESIHRLNEHLKQGNAVVFFDHHYAFDALPVSLTLGEVLKNAEKALIPYAIHLDLGVDGKGKPSRRYRIRTAIFQWIIRKVQHSNPNIQIMPVARNFELSNEHMKAKIAGNYKGKNVNYLQTFVQSFQNNPSGFLCILSPIAGLAFPHKPILHDKLYILLEKIQSQLKDELQFYYVSAYPNLNKKWHYRFPMLVQHDFVVRGNFELPKGDYKAANDKMKEEVQHLRQTAHFKLLDYDVIKNK